MGKFNSGSNAIYQELAGVLPGGVWSMPASFNGNIYYGPVGSPLLDFRFKNAKLLAAAVARSSNSFGYPGTTPSVSANGSTQRDCMGSGKQQSRGAACVRRQDPGGTLQLEPGCEQSGSLRQWQQVHHADDCPRQGVCGNNQRSGRVWIVGEVDQRRGVAVTQPREVLCRYILRKAVRVTGVSCGGYE